MKKFGEFLEEHSLILKMAGLALLVVLIILAPQGLNNYYLTVINSSLIYFISCMGYTIMMGMGGMMPMATVTFMGFAAFFTARLSRDMGLNTILAGFLGFLGSTLIAYILSLMLVRLEGNYFVMGTIGLCNMMATVFNNYIPLSNGADGISGIPKLTVFGFQFVKLKHWFILLAFTALFIALGVERIRSSNLGRSLMSIRDNPVAAQTLGVDIRKTKRVAVTIGAALAALAGVLVGYHNRVVSAGLFTYNVQQNMLIMVMLGGINSSVGALAGAMMVGFMPEFLRPILEYMRLVQGIILILLMVFMPMGIAGICNDLWKKMKTGTLFKKEEGAADGKE